MYSGSEKYYDDIYSAMGKDYAAEAYQVHQFIQKHKRTEGNTLLDVACGTGTHAGFLSEYYQVTGTDLSANMLKVARKKHPEIQFIECDMRRLDLGRQFDAVTCLFSAIGYMKTKADLRRAVKSMSRHLRPGGVLLVEPWFSQEQWNVGRVSINRVEKPDIKIVRMALARKRGRVSLLKFQYLIGTSKGIEHLTEQLALGLFDHEEYLNAFTRAGLQVTHDPEGIFGRGLYIGTQPLEQAMR
jgi:ubiquinone/menaquinone biosynthesis C-methylase UbiE